MFIFHPTTTKCTIYSPTLSCKLQTIGILSLLLIFPWAAFTSSPEYVLNKYLLSVQWFQTQAGRATLIFWVIAWGLPKKHPFWLQYWRKWASLVAQWLRICLQCRRCRRCRFDPWVGKIPWRRNWQPTPIFLTEKSHRGRSLVGYSPCCHKESDATECVHVHSHTHTHTHTWENSYRTLLMFPFKLLQFKIQNGCTSNSCNSIHLSRTLDFEVLPLGSSQMTLWSWRWDDFFFSWDSLRPSLGLCSSSCR